MAIWPTDVLPLLVLLGGVKNRIFGYTARNTEGSSVNKGKTPTASCKSW